MKRIVQLMALTGCLLISLFGYSQSLSQNTVTFTVTYDAQTQRYTAWVVPQYSVPNTNNTGTTESGSTAQFTLKVPAAFVIQSILDVNGIWEKSPIKLGPGISGQSWNGLDPAYNYYVIGKSSTETNYGSFQAGTPVPLFTFSGNGCSGPITPLPLGDAFITVAENQASLNVNNSFYSRSGQLAGGNVVPREQFAGISGPAADCRPLSAIADSGTVTAGSSSTVAVLANDTNRGNPASTTNVTVTVSGPPASGTAVIRTNGTLVYTAPAGFTGVVSLTYTICDLTTTTLCSSAPVSFTVLPVPVVRSIIAYNDNGVGSQGGTITGNVSANDDLATGTGPLVVSTIPLSGPSNGSLQLFADGTFIYTPVSSFTGTDSFVYQVCDSGTPPVCATAIVTLKVQPTSVSGTNAAPVALGDNFSVKQDQTLTGNVLTNDRDPDSGQTLTVTTIPVTPTTHGSLTLNSNGTFTYVPTAGYTGTDGFVYQVCDNGNPSLCAQARVKIVVLAPAMTGLEPVANDDLFYRNPGQGVTGNVLTNDSDPAGLALTVTTTPLTAPSNGTVTLSSNGTFSYVAAAGYNGPDTFVYQVCNTNNKCSQATVFIMTSTVSQTATADVRVKKTVSVPSGQTVAIGSSIVYTIVVSNQGPDPSTGVVVTDLLPASLSYISSTATKGTYVPSTGLWSVGSLTVNQSVSLVITAQVQSDGIILNQAALTGRDQTDPNSGNDASSACVSVPIKLCSSEMLELRIPDSYQQVQWFYNGQLMTGVSGSSITVSLPGQYTFQANNTDCPQTGCCPLIVVDGNCCIPVCVPIAISKRKR